jgi:hypothetical protein
MKYLFLIMALSLLGCSEPKRECIESKMVLNVGGCDKYGQCGVLFEDETGGVIEYPVVGARYCTKYKEQQ